MAEEVKLINISGIPVFYVNYRFDQRQKNKC